MVKENKESAGAQSAEDLGKIGVSIKEGVVQSLKGINDLVPNGPILYLLAGIYHLFAGIFCGHYESGVTFVSLNIVWP